MKNSNTCLLCPRRCGVNRDAAAGFCRSGTKATVAKVMLHRWEEPCISVKNGSGAVFFCGCSLHCIYCQNHEISGSAKTGKAYTDEELAQIFSELEAAGADNINLVTPTHFAPAICRALEIYRPKIPIVYNSSGYETLETLQMLEPFIDIYLLDYKYADFNLAKSYSHAPDYPSVVTSAISECVRQRPKALIENGKMLSGVIIRHLLLPMAAQNAISVVDWVSAHAKNAYFSLMCQYTPCGDNLPKPLQRKVTEREYNKVANYVLQSGLENVYFQDFESASKIYIPDFKT